MVRIWCVPVSELDRQHLLGEHKELHVIWSVIVNQKKGYSRHPETLRFKTGVSNLIGLSQLFHRHQQQVEEMKQRGYNHKSPLLTVNGNLASAYPMIKKHKYTYSEEEYRRDHEELARRQNK